MDKKYNLLAVCLLAFAVTGCLDNVEETDRYGKLQAELDRLKDEVRLAQDTRELQNIMSRRAMYHSIGRNEKELALWAQHTEIRWAQNQGCWIGREAIEAYYVTTNYEMQKAQLKNMSQANPAIANDYSKNRYIGNNIFHLLTTPIIEIAGDGLTAKGFWYTPGAILSSTDGLSARGMYMWERYGVDFIREGGEWRFRNIEVLTDFGAGFGEPLAVQQAGAMMGSEGGAATTAAPGPGATGIDVPGPTIAQRRYQEYSPTRLPTLSPGLPEPYKTFSETFAYADCSDSPYPPK